jgi:drug/metabolite transporter (DMT)-like permease
MTTAPTDAASPPRVAKGIILMIAAMLSIPLVDGLAKYLSADYSPLFLSWARYVVACGIALPLAVSRHGARMFPAEQLAAHTLRTVFLVAGMTLYYLAIARIPLATVASAYFIGPIVAVVLSVAVLKERLTFRKIASLVLGFAGSLVILQPGRTVDPALIMAFGAGLFFALYMIATRKASKDSDPLKTLTWSVPMIDHLMFFAGMGVFSVVSHSLSITAFRLTDASTLAPLVYVELIGAALIGYFAFGEVPGVPTVIGAALIVGAGLILLQRRNGTGLA